MAIDLSSPAAQLAWEAANRNAEAKQLADQYIADRTAMQNAARLIAPYGGDIADYTAQLGASDEAARKRAQMADLYRNYVIGRPELLVQSAMEKAKASGGGGGGGYYAGGGNIPFDAQAMADYLLGGVKPVVKPKAVTRTGTADTAGRLSTAAPVRAVRSGGPALRMG